jgi:sortase A
MIATRRSPRVAVWLRAAELILLAAGSIALAWVLVTRLAIARDQESWARALESQVAARPARAAAPRKGDLIARIEMPRLGLSAMTREGTDPETLERSVGHVANTALPGERGNAAFAGHRDTFFRSLKHVRTGDRIIVTTPDARHQYVVRDTRVVPPGDVSVLDPTPGPTLTLVTCFPFSYIGPAPRRFIVRADLIDVPRCGARSFTPDGVHNSPPDTSRSGWQE